jgi:ribonuclease VapC
LPNAEWKLNVKQKRSSPPPQAPTSPVVLDSSAILTYLRQENGAQLVAACLQGALLSTVNLCEVLAKTAEYGGDCTLARELLVGFDVSFVEFTEIHASVAADLRGTTRQLGLSLGDRACLALGIQEKATVVTADRAWANIAVPAKVFLIR